MDSAFAQRLLDIGNWTKADKLKSNLRTNLKKSSITSKYIFKES
jgi:hypothetical protein